MDSQRSVSGASEEQSSVTRDRCPSIQSENFKASSGITNNEEDKKPVIQRGTHINVKIKDQYNNEVSILIKRNTPLENILITYCKERSVDFKTFRFLSDGKRLRVEMTADELGMEDGDQIDAMLEQSAGAGNGGRWRRN